MSHRRFAAFRLAVATLTLSASCFALLGCSSKEVPAKTELTEQDKQQIEELNKQRVDEWGKPVK